MKGKEINNKTMWAYFAPDGYLQVRSLSETKKEARYNIARSEILTDYKKYEKNGYTLQKVKLTVTLTTK